MGLISETRDCQAVLITIFFLDFQRYTRKYTITTPLGIAVIRIKLRQTLAFHYDAYTGLRKKQSEFSAIAELLNRVAPK